MFELNQVTIFFGLAAALAVAIVTAYRQGRLAPADLGAFVTAFFAGNNIPVAIWLCAYGIAPDAASANTRLHGNEKYVALAGACLLFMGIVGLWALIQQAYATRPAPVAQSQGSQTVQQPPAAKEVQR